MGMRGMQMGQMNPMMAAQAMAGTIGLSGGANYNPFQMMTNPGQMAQMQQAMQAQQYLQPNYGTPSSGPHFVPLQVPGLGYVGYDGKHKVYPETGTKSITVNSPYSPFNYGGYDSYGFPMPHPGVASSTPVWPPPGAEASKPAAA